VKREDGFGEIKGERESVEGRGERGQQVKNKVKIKRKRDRERKIK